MKKISFKSLKLSFILIAVTLLLIFFHYIKILQPIEILILKLINPLEEITYNLSNKINNYFQFKAEERIVFEENKKLKEQINKLTSEIIRLKILEEENKTLRKELSFLEEKKYKFLLARVIGKDPFNSSVIIINKGRGDGIEPGFPIIVDEGIIVGKVIKVQENNSLVLLLTNNQSKIAASILGINRTIGIVEGEYGLSLKMGLIQRNQIINIDDIVVTSGLENNIPAGLIIGRISRITTEAHDLFQNAIVKPFVSYENLNIVSVIIP